MSSRELTIFDGGMGHLLKEKNLKLACLEGQQPDKFFLPGLFANVEQPRIVEDLITAGAEVITTNSFVATPWALRSVGKEQELFAILEVGSAMSPAVSQP